MPRTRPARITTALSATPYADESLIGFIFRLALRRRAHARALLFELGADGHFTNQMRPELLRELSASARVPLANLEAISYGPYNRTTSIFRGRPLPAALFDRTTDADRRFCPDCLVQRPYHRAIWDLALISGCPVHDVYLVAACVCGAPVKWKGKDLARCGACKVADFRKSPREPIPPTQLEVTRAIYGLLGDPRFRSQASALRRAHPFIDLRDEHIVDFMWRLALETMGSRRKIFSLDHPGELAWDAHVGLTRAARVIAKWPTGFFKVLDTMRQRLPASATITLRKYVVPVERWLGHLPPECGMEIRKQVAGYRARDPH